MAPLDEIPRSGEKPPQSLYRARVSEDLDRPLSRIEALTRGEEPIIHLEDGERAEMMKYEDEIGAELEGIYDITVLSSKVYLDGFASRDQRAGLKKIFSDEEIPADSEQLKKFLLDRSEKILKADPAIRTEIFGNAQKEVDANLASKLLTETGNLDFSKAKIPDRCEIILNPDALLEKFQKLTEFKSKLKYELHTAAHEESNGAQAKMEILKMYLARLNEMIVELYPDLYSIAAKAQITGTLSASETALLESATGSTHRERSLARLDKFLRGAAREYSDTYRNQVSPILKQRADTVTKVREIEESRKEDLIRVKGLDPDKVLRKLDIDSEQRARWGEEVLKHYGLLSSESRSTFNPDRGRPANDNKWQYVPRANKRSKSVDKKLKIVNDPEGKKENIVNALVTGGAHEIEGHVLQHVNKEKIPLRLFRKVGGDRTAALAEGGAMFIESKLKEEFFGFKGMAHPHYVRAMQKKLQGGSYLECVKAFYDSAIAEIRTKYPNPADPLEHGRFMKEARKTLDDAIDRAKRLFRGSDLSGTSNFLPNSKDTVYLEQELLMEQLEKKGLLKFAFIGGMNLGNAATLLKLGLLDPNQIQEPHFYTREIWKREKEKYGLEAA